jgi:hypothetical protein
MNSDVPKNNSAVDPDKRIILRATSYFRGATLRKDIPADVFLEHVQVPAGTHLPEASLTAFFGLKIAVQQMQIVSRACAAQNLQAWPVQIELSVAPSRAGARLDLAGLQALGAGFAPRSSALVVTHLAKDAQNYLFDKMREINDRKGGRRKLDDPFEHYNRFVTGRADLVAQALLEDPLFRPFGAFIFEVRDPSDFFWSYVSILNRALISKVGSISDVTLHLPDDLRPMSA